MFKIEYMGCVHDERDGDLPDGSHNPYHVPGGLGTIFKECSKEQGCHLTPAWCAARCFSEQKLSFMGLQFGNQCLCGSNYSRTAPRDAECIMPCQGSKEHACGGFNRNSVYKLAEAHCDSLSPGSKFGATSETLRVGLAHVVRATDTTLKVTKDTDPCEPWTDEPQSLPTCTLSSVSKHENDPLSWALKGKWVQREDGSCEFRMPFCRLERFNITSAKELLRGHHVWWVGDSLTRYQYLSLASFIHAGEWLPRLDFTYLHATIFTSLTLEFVEVF